MYPPTPKRKKLLGLIIALCSLSLNSGLLAAAQEPITPKSTLLALDAEGAPQAPYFERICRHLWTADEPQPIHIVFAAKLEVTLDTLACFEATYPDALQQLCSTLNKTPGQAPYATAAEVFAALSHYLDAYMVVQGYEAEAEAWLFTPDPAYPGCTNPVCLSEWIAQNPTAETERLVFGKKAIDWSVFTKKNQTVGGVSLAYWGTAQEDTLESLERIALTLHVFLNEEQTRLIESTPQTTEVLSEFFLKKYLPATHAAKEATQEDIEEDEQTEEDDDALTEDPDSGNASDAQAQGDSDSDIEDHPESRDPLEPPYEAEILVSIVGGLLGGDYVEESDQNDTPQGTPTPERSPKVSPLTSPDLSPLGSPRSIPGTHPLEPEEEPEQEQQERIEGGERAFFGEIEQQAEAALQLQEPLEPVLEPALEPEAAPLLLPLVVLELQPEPEAYIVPEIVEPIAAPLAAADVPLELIPLGDEHPGVFAVYAEPIDPDLLPLPEDIAEAVVYQRISPTIYPSVVANLSAKKEALQQRVELRQYTKTLSKKDRQKFLFNERVKNTILRKEKRRFASTQKVQSRQKKLAQQTQLHKTKALKKQKIQAKYNKRILRKIEKKRQRLQRLLQRKARRTSRPAAAVA